ncbi:MAG: acetylxylan esterase [Armatimonadota bacterium]
MPILDMPLDELKKYRGRNPRPANFDAYWDEAIAEMKSVDPNMELIPCPTQSKTAEYFDLYFTGVGGARVHAKYMRPKNCDQPHPAVLIFHGYTGNAGDWFNMRAWIAEDFSVAALDCRGQGGLSEDIGGVKGTTYNGHIIRGLSDSPEKLLFRSIFLDCAQLASIVMKMPEVDASRVGAAGLSQGGALTLACAALEPNIKRAAPIFPFLCDYKRVWEMDLAKNAYAELVSYFKYFDPLHECEDEIFARLGYIDCQHLAPKIRADVLMLTGLMDITCPPSTQFAAYNKITSKKDMVVYPDFEHEPLPNSMDIVFDFLCEL